MTQPKKPLIPPHILWPGMVIAFLAFCVGTQTYLVISANSDGGAQIEQNYYQRSLQWDEDQANRERSRRLGWKITAEVSPQIILAITDAEGKPLENLEGEVELRRPNIAGALSTSPLKVIPGRPGLYTTDAATDRPGLWDLTVRANRGSDTFITTVRKEVGT